MTTFIIVLLCSAFTYWLGTQIEKMKAAPIVKSLVVENQALTGSAKEYISNTRVEFIEKVMDDRTGSCCTFLAESGYCTYEEAWNEIAKVREASALSNMEAKLNQKMESSPSIDDQIAISILVSKDCADACAKLISEKSAMTKDDAYDLVIEYTYQAITNRGQDLMRGTWTSPSNGYYALLYGHDHPLAMSS